MKFFFAAVLALPVALAVPTARLRHAIAITVRATSLRPRAYTLVPLNAPVNGPPMETVFTDAYCFEATGSALSKGVCKSVKLCKDTRVPENPDIGIFYQLC
ncbi:uncharacterized protein B0H64DRAFT_436338 [Chaetomium fimeti]|uniref:Uncharacterized protein n=1 Tax=Chaetomium fimeti TaxID=1854472 RepID=A0AAE0H6P0_9PEZI|nr:hypothetical protein B0H64DRAFT_436338 [Chaetomium fimeti]